LSRERREKSIAYKTIASRVSVNAIVPDEAFEVEEADKEANLVALVGAVIQTLPVDAKAHLKRDFFH
jgi:hypothetical protein